jgi:hypothetical protein
LSTIVITQNDYGYIIEVSVVDKKTPVKLTSCSVVGTVVAPDGSKIPVDTITMKDDINGIVEFTLDPEHKEQVGVHKLYIEVSDGYSSISAKEPVIYYVQAENGGA